MTTGDLEALVLAGRKSAGRFSVRDVDGAVVATVRAPWYASSFTASAPDGTVLCTAGAGLAGLSSTWVVAGSDGSTILTLRWRWTSSTARLVLPGGGELELRARAWRSGFTIIDATGHEVARAEPRSSRFGLGRCDHLLRNRDGRLGLAELVAVSQIWRVAEESAVFA